MASAIVSPWFLHTIPFESIVDSPRGMVLLLFRDVVQNPREIVLAETHNSIASLPVQDLVIDLAVDVVRASTFELLDKFADGHGWFEADCEMNMGWRTADAVKPDALGLFNSRRDVGVDLLLKLGIQEWHAQLCVPVEMQEDLVVHVA
ncbi:MAG: hypothetical protein ACI92S_000863 [Planctomycetaceae bacterium]|jgi:hypothetical protein